jgi:hypothetical protein
MTYTPNTSSTEYHTGLQAIEKLQKLEARYDLFRHQIDGFSAWRLLRLKAYTQIQNLPLEKLPDYVTWNWLVERFILFLPDTIRFFFPRKAKYVIKTFSSALREQEGDLYRDVYFDDIYEDLKDCYKIETLNNLAFWRRRARALYPIDMTTSVIDLLSGIASFLGFPSGIDRIVDTIHEATQTEPTLGTLTKSRIARTLQRFYWSKKLYTYLLRRIRPRFVITASQNEYAIWAAAKQLGLFTIEFQHGIFPPYDADALPSLPAEYRKSLIVPDRILVYGEYWKRELAKNPYTRNEWVAVGKPIIDKYRALRFNNKRFVDQDSPCKVLLTTQGIDRQNLITFIEHFLQIAHGRLKYELVIKLHPGFEKSSEIYQTTLGKHPNIQILLGNENPSTYQLLSMADFHVSISSTSHYDALGIGVPTIILPLVSCEEVLHLAERGHAKTAPTPEDLLHILLHDRGVGVPTDVSAHYCTPNALDNIRRVIESLIEDD